MTTTEKNRELSQVEPLLTAMNEAEAEIIRLREINAELLNACKVAMWIHDKQYDQRAWGCSLEEWDAIAAAITNAEAQP